jgi:hypothetical protein
MYIRIAWSTFQDFSHHQLISLRIQFFSFKSLVTRISSFLSILSILCAGHIIIQFKCILKHSFLPSWPTFNSWPATVPSRALLAMPVERVPPLEVSPLPSQIFLHQNVELTDSFIVDQSTPRDGTTRNPFQQDTTRFRGNAADTCGETLEVSQCSSRTHFRMLTNNFQGRC